MNIFGGLFRCVPLAMLFIRLKNRQFKVAIDPVALSAQSMPNVKVNRTLDFLSDT